MTEHIGEKELKIYGESILPRREFLRVQTHLETCEDCRRRLDEMFPNIAEAEEVLLLKDLTDETMEEFHLNYEEHLKPFVYGTIDAVEREIVESHVEICADCREDLRDLLQFHEELEREKEIRALSKRGFWTRVSDWFAAPHRQVVWLAFAAVLIAFNAGLIWFFAPRPTIKVVQNPTNTNDLPNNQTVENAQIENIFPLNQNEDTPKTNQSKTADQNTDLPEKEIELANLVLPAFLNDLRMNENETLRGGNDLPTQKIAVVAPNAKVIRASAPVLSWKQIPGVENYEVMIFDNKVPPNEIAKIENLRGNSLRVPNLTKGKIYQWQVTAKNISADGKTRNYLGQGKFYIVSQPDENRINKARNALERGKALAEAGLLAEAAGEFRKHLKQNPDSENARKFLRQIKQAQR